jgi:serine/threonine protein kinase
MTPERYREIKEIVGAVIDCEPAQREAMLAEACRDDQPLRVQVDKLLKRERPAVDFMEESPFDGFPSLHDEEGPSLTDRLIGPYRILKEIGRGGMGAVYLAVREDLQYQRNVAIKFMKRGMDTDSILRRFRNEQQILANLNHPNIAGLYSGGATADGLPYFVMEYVEGLPIDQYCDAHRLSTEERLKLFRTICLAAQYAHQNLVVHRDIKPSNILVTAEGVPKLLDFGIGKLLHPDLPHQTIEATATNLRVMTPEYASPEQVRGGSVTTSTDVYSLGVVLYELLTGQRPHKFRSRQPADIVQAICIKEPEKPSQAVSRRRSVVGRKQKDEGQLTADSGRRTKPALRNAKLLRGDLDNIVLKALRKEPQRRYASVEQLSEDLRRHLEGLPVIARNDTLKYRTSKFIRRNRIGVAAAAIVALALVGGIIATAWEAHVAHAQRAKAEQRFNAVRNMATTFLFELNDEVEREPTEARELIVKRAIEYLDSLASDGGNDASLQRDLATAYQRLGDVQSRLHGQNLGDTSGALVSYHKSLAIREKLFAADPKDEQTGLDLALSYNRMGDVLSKTNHAAAALDSYRNAVRLVEGLHTHASVQIQTRRDLGYDYLAMARAQLKLGDLPGALASFQGSQRIREELATQYPAESSFRADLASTYNGIAYVLSQQGNTAEALAYYRKSLAIARDLVTADALDTKARRLLMDTLEWTGITMGEMGENAAGLDYQNKALALCQSLLNADATNAQAQNDIADVYQEIGNTMVRLGRPGEALINFRKSIQSYEAVAKADPTDKNARRQVYATYRYLGDGLSEAGDTIGALENYRKALAVFQELSTADPSNAETQYDIALSYRKIGEVLARIGDQKAALDNFREAAPIFEVLAKRSPTNTKTRGGVALTYFDLGNGHAKLASSAKSANSPWIEHWQEARKWDQKSLDIWQDLRNHGTLTKADTDKPDEVAREIAKCDAGLKKLGSK